MIDGGVNRIAEIDRAIDGIGISENVVGFRIDILLEKRIDIFAIDGSRFDLQSDWPTTLDCENEATARHRHSPILPHRKNAKANPLQRPHRSMKSDKTNPNCPWICYISVLSKLMRLARSGFDGALAKAYQKRTNGIKSCDTMA